MSFKKTELMSIVKSTSLNPIVPLGNEGNIKVVERFKYLGAFSSADDTNIKDLNKRIGKAAGAFRELEKVWKDRHLKLDIEMKFYNSCFLSTFLYAAECWSLTERDEARLDAFDMRCQRKLLQIVWSQRITNKYIGSVQFFRNLPH